MYFNQAILRAPRAVRPQLGVGEAANWSLHSKCGRTKDQSLHDSGAPYRGRPVGRESVSDRGGAHPVRSLGLFRTLSLSLSHMLLVCRRQLAPGLLCRPGDIEGFESRRDL